MTVLAHLTARTRRSRMAIAATGVVVLACTGTGIALAVSGDGSTENAGNPNLPSDKASRLQQEQQRHDQARSAAANAPASLPPMATPQSPEPRRVGIDNDMHEGPFPSSQFLVQNFYQGPAVQKQGRWNLVYSGTNDPYGKDQAALWVMQEDADVMNPGPVTTVGMFPAPTGSSLTIVSATAPELTVRTDAGQTYTFDLTNDTYQ